MSSETRARGAMRSPSRHLDDNTVVDLLAAALRGDEAAAVAAHLVTCAPCAEVVEACREVCCGELGGDSDGDVVGSALLAQPD